MSDIRYSFRFWQMEMKIPLVIHGLDINLGFFREVRLSGAYFLRKQLKADTNLSKYISVRSEEASSSVFKNASIASCMSIFNQLPLNWPVSL